MHVTSLYSTLLCVDDIDIASYPIGSLSIAPIVGGAVSGVILLVLIVAFALCIYVYRKRRRGQRRGPSIMRYVADTSRYQLMICSGVAKKPPLVTTGTCIQRPLLFKDHLVM